MVTTRKNSVNHFTGIYWFVLKTRAGPNLRDDTRIKQVFGTRSSIDPTKLYPIEPCFQDGWTGLDAWGPSRTSRTINRRPGRLIDPGRVPWSSWSSPIWGTYIYHIYNIYIYIYYSYNNTYITPYIYTHTHLYTTSSRL